MTLNDVMAAYLRYFAEFGRFWALYYVKMGEDTSIHSASEIHSKESSFSGISLMAVFAGKHP